MGKAAHAGLRSYRGGTVSTAAPSGRKSSLAPGLAQERALHHSVAMPKTTPRLATPLPVLMMELTWASWETIGWRTWMMVQGTCSPAEYSRMVREKMDASRRSADLLARCQGELDWAALMAPWHLRATANAKRLRRN